VTGTAKRDSYFERWDHSRISENQRIWRVVQVLSAGLVRGDVLDLGCGSRVYYDTSGARQWVGMDLSQAMLDDLRFVGSRPPEGAVEKLNRDCGELPFADESFDTVCAMFLLHHLGRVNRRRSRRAVLDVLRGARRVMRSGGTMLILETWPQILLRLYHLGYPLLYPLARRWLSVELPYFFAPRALKRMAAEAGFSECYCLVVNLREAVRQPVGGFVLPAWLQPLFQKYVIYVVKA